MKEQEPVEFELSKEYLDRLKEAIEGEGVAFIQESLAEVKPADIVTLLYEFETDDCKYVLDHLDTEISAQIINELDTDIREKFLLNFSPNEIAAFVDNLDSDDAVDILNELPVRLREDVIALVSNEEKARHIQELLRYDEDCAGGLMAKELIKCNENWSVVQCIEEIRRQAGNVDKIYTVYVVDDKDNLLGRVSLKRIILSEDKTRVADLYDQDVISVETYMHEEEVASIMQKYDLEVVPVVNLRGKLVGRITIDDIIDVITELAEEERQLMAGISSDVESNDSVWMLSKARLPWLVIGMLGGMLGARFIGFFEADIALIPAMAFFIPLITATGGNVGIQSSSLVVQSLAQRSAFEDSLLKRLTKVFLVAIVNGTVLALIVLGINLLIGDSQKLAIVVALALFCVVLLASFMGTITPLVLDKVGVNPAVASGPFITTANDLLGLGVYFSVAHLLFTNL